MDKQKHSDYQNQYLKNRRLSWLKDNGPCKECGSWNNLEVDHIDESTKITHRVWGWNEQRRSEELAKCQVLCYDCHKKKTVEFLKKSNIGIFMGHRHALSKLNVDDIINIKSLYETGNFTHRSLAKKFNVSKTTISCILENKSYIF